MIWIFVIGMLAGALLLLMLQGGGTMGLQSWRARCHHCNVEEQSGPVSEEELVRWRDSFQKRHQDCEKKTFNS